jgi:uncharacterized protein
VNPPSHHVGVAVVTGGSAGLGVVIAEKLLAGGYDVIIVGRDRRRLVEAQERLCAASASRQRRIQSIVADVVDEQSVQHCFQQVAAEFGRLDVLVNCVGQSDRGRVDSLPHQRLIELIDANVSSALLCSQAALPLLKQSEGVVVNIGSLASKVGARYLGGYCAAKHALAGLTQQMRLEWSEYGIHVALISPGPIRRDDAGRRYANVAADAPPAAQRPGGGAKLKGLPPQRVADAVLRCIAKRRPDVILPGYLRVLVAVGHAFPWFGDWLLRKFTSSSSG